jgi:hypothetical protein
MENKETGGLCLKVSADFQEDPVIIEKTGNEASPSEQLAITRKVGFSSPFVWPTIDNTPIEPAHRISTARYCVVQTYDMQEKIMRTLCLLFLSLFISASLHAQNAFVFEKDYSSYLHTGEPLGLFKHGAIRDASTHPVRVRYASTDPVRVRYAAEDSMKYNMYGDLREDDPLYNSTSSLGVSVMRVTLANATTLLIDRYLLNFDFSRVGFNSWKHNIQTGWEWDNDRFAMNNFFHPISGAMSFNGGRANGYSFYESVPFSALGSLEWEYFGETTLPSYNDIINTTVDGAFYGEILYRIGSNILDDQSSGAERFFRELAVGLITPTRFLSRLMRGELARSTPEEVYQKEPMNITLSAGYHRVNEGIGTKLGSNSMNVNLHLDYGNPFEKRTRKPYDYFKVRADFDFGVGRKIIDNVTGYGILFGKNVKAGQNEMLVGLFQHMNFFDNKTFEIGTIAFGPGVISKLPMTKSTSLYTNIHVDVVPFGSMSGRLGPDTSQFRDYNYGGGAEATLESTFNIGGWTSLTFIGYYWWFRTFVGVAGNSYVALLKPRISFNIYKNMSIGFEHLIYYSDRYPRDYASVHSVRTEQKIYFQLYLEEFKFKR